MIYYIFLNYILLYHYSHITAQFPLKRSIKVIKDKILRVHIFHNCTK